MSNSLISTRVEQQLPDFIRGDNPKFVFFLEKYYEWLEQSNNAIGQTQDLYNAKDLDEVNNFYFDQIVKEILPNFPKDILLDKSKFVKHVGEFYRSKGTPESIKFLFRILYNEEIEIYYPKEQIIKVSDGKWVLPLALRVETGDLNIFDIERTKITGVQSKASAVVEKVIKSVDRQLGIEYIELYISNIDKLFLTGENVSTTIVRTNVGGSPADPEYNNGAISNVVGDGSDFFKREVTVNGVRVMAAGGVGGQTAVPDAWLEKVARMFELFTDPNGAGINSTLQRNLIKNLSGDTGTYHAGLPTIQRVARGAGADYSTNFLTDPGIVFWNLTNLFDTHVQNDMVWYLNSTGDGYGVGDIDAQEVIEHVFHTLHMHGLDAVSLKMYSYISADWASGPLYAAMEEAYDAGKWDSSGYGGNAWKTDGDAFEVAAKEYLYLLNFCMFEYTELWDGGSLAPEWTDDMRTQAGIQANNPLGYAFHNTYIAPVISKPSLATIRSIFQDGNTPAQDNPALAGASGYVVDALGTTDFVTAKLIGSLSEIKIDPRNRGLFYNGFDPDLDYDGDPVTIIGGLNPTSGNPIGALATVGEVLRGSVDDIITLDGGFGFRSPTIYPDSSVIDFRGGFEGGILGAEAKASISFLDDSYYRTINVSNYTIESFFGSTINGIDNVANTKTIDELTTKQTLNLSSIAFISVDSSGGGYRQKPNVDIFSLYIEELGDTLIIQSATAVQGTNVLRDETQDLTNSFEPGEKVRLFLKNRYEEIKTVTNVTSSTVTFDSFFENDINNLTVFKLTRRDVSDVGSLGRIDVLNGGENYAVGEYLIFTSDGRGYGANANVSEVHIGNNGIKSVEFNETSDYVRGGEGYTMIDLPTITVDSESGEGAQLVVREIVGKGTNLDLSTSRIGAISTIRVVSYGYDYISAPTISLRNADLLLTDVTEGQIFVANTRIYQGESNTNSSFSAFVDRFFQANNFLRMYNYKGTFNRELELKSDDNLVSANIVTASFYGDGKAKATAGFENGLIRYPGIYLNTDGQPSSDQKLQDERKYHNYSYVINTENDYYKFKKTLRETVHPIGMRSFVTKIDTNEKVAANTSFETIFLTRTETSNTFNISNSSNNMVVTDTLNVSSEVSIGDIIILKDLSRQIDGFANITSSSNVVTGNGTNFINDITDGQIIELSSGNTVIVESVINANTIYVSEILYVTETDLTINVRFDATKNVNFTNTDMILVDSDFTTTNDYVTVIIQKVR